MKEEPTRFEFDAALRKMQFGKRGGSDDVTIELIRFGSNSLKDAVFQVVTETWRAAGSAKARHEADNWCDSSKEGVCIPMYKKKGSVSAKIVARLAACRLSSWLEGWMSEEQNGFRAGRGIDDVHQFVRRLLEEVSVSSSTDSLGFTSFDIVRAYTRVCRSALRIS